MKRLLLGLLVFSSLWASHASGTVAPPADKDEPLESGSVLLLTFTNLGLSAANIMAIADDGSYLLGTMSIVAGVATYAVVNSYLDRSLTVDVTAGLAITSGVLAIFRKIAFDESDKVSVEPFVDREGYGLAARVEF